MGLSFAEQETIIRWDRAEKEMQVYTSDAYLLQRLKKYPDYKLISEDKQEGQTIAATFKADKSLCTLRKSKPKGRAMSEEEKEALRQRNKARMEAAGNVDSRADS